MLRTLKLCGYRSFTDYRLENLSRVNLLVGKNNSGKTSILEATQFLTSKGDPWPLIAAARRRGEMNPVGDSDDRPRSVPNLSHLFPGHRLTAGSTIRIDSDSHSDGLTVTVVDLDPQQALELERHSSDDFLAPSLGLEITAGAPRAETLPLPLTDDGSLPLSYRFVRRRIRDGSRPSPPLQLLTPDSRPIGSMGSMWNKVLKEGMESDVESAMKILEPDLTSIHFLLGTESYTSPGSGVLLGLGAEDKRIPIGSYGDGMRRLLELSLSLIHTAGGTLLVDEIDTGLHWTVMADMWKLVLEAAVRFSLQVFATTHSYDCLLGLKHLLDTHPNLRPEVSVQKVAVGLEKAVDFDAEVFRTAIEQGTELR